jgi:hypothetical protein
MRVRRTDDARALVARAGALTAGAHRAPSSCVRRVTVTIVLPLVSLAWVRGHAAFLPRLGRCTRRGRMRLAGPCRWRRLRRRRPGKLEFGRYARMTVLLSCRLRLATKRVRLGAYGAYLLRLFVLWNVLQGDVHMGPRQPLGPGGVWFGGRCFELLSCGRTRTLRSV